MTKKGHLSEKEFVKESDEMSGKFEKKLKQYRWNGFIEQDNVSTSNLVHILKKKKTRERDSVSKNQKGLKTSNNWIKH